MQAQMVAQMVDHTCTLVGFGIKSSLQIPFTISHSIIAGLSAVLGH